MIKWFFNNWQSLLGSGGLVALAMLIFTIVTAVKKKDEEKNKPDIYMQEALFSLDELNVAYNQGRSYYNDGNFKQAIKCFSEASLKYKNSSNDQCRDLAMVLNGVNGNTITALRVRTF